jgi:hypothetical protein
VLTSSETPPAAAEAPEGFAPLSRPQLSRLLRARIAQHLFDDSAVEPAGVAIYSLADPRDARTVRYVGQTTAPRRRWLQHLNTARLWLPDDTPWWASSPKLRPLYAWLRQLHHEGGRLPVMLVTQWVEPARARSAERARICACLERHGSLLNYESELLRSQLLLL